MELLKLESVNNHRKISQLKKQIETKQTDCFDDIQEGKNLFDVLMQNRTLEKPNQKAMKQILAYYRTIAPDFFVALKSRYNTLTPQNQLILMLRDIGKSDMEICHLLGVSEVSLRSYATRIRKCLKEDMAIVLLFIQSVA